MNEKPEAETSWFGVPIICENKDLKASLVAYLEKNKIQTRNYFAGNILMHPAYRHMGDAKLYPNASSVLDNVFFVGTSPVITMPMLDYIYDIVSEYKPQ